MRRIEHKLGLLLILFLLQSTTFADDKPWIDPAGIPGSVLLCGEALPAEAIQRFIELSQGGDSRIVILYESEDEGILAASNAVFNEWHHVSGKELHVVRLNREDEEALESVIRTINDATGVWIVGSDAETDHVGFAHEPLRTALVDLLKRDGAIGLHGVHPSLVSGNFESMPAVENFAEGALNLFPNVVIDTTSSANDSDANVATLLADHPDLVGIELEQDAALVIRGRHLIAIGDGVTSVQLAESPNKPAQSFVMKDRNALMDLVALRKAANDRVGEKFPPDEPRDPFVPDGTLIIIGGGGMPNGIISRFVELAGGDEACILVLPTAMGDPLPAGSRLADEFARAGAKEVHVLNGRTRDVVEGQEYVGLFSRATGIWFGGGRQWRFVDAYYDTMVHPLMFDVLARGGVIMGSSAGASIQAEYMARGTPIGNSDIIADGYERGLGFLPGAAVDQHFAQRRRFGDMTSLIERYPQLLGIGIDEATALVVTKGKGEITGRGSVHFYDARRKIGEGENDYETVHNQGIYDLVNRVIIEPGEPAKAERANRGTARPRPPRPPITRKERATRMAQSAMNSFDKNQDGLLDEDEVSELRQPVLDADANEDGKVSQEELTAWLLKQFENQNND